MNESRVTENYADAIQALRQGAGQLVSLTTILQGAYFAVASFKDLRGMLSWPMVAVALTPVACWLISIAFALAVQMPVITEHSTDTPDKELASYLRKRVASLRRGLRVAHALLVAGLIALMINLALYLAILPPAPSAN